MDTGWAVDIPACEELFELLPQAVLLLDGRLEVRVANKAAADLFGIPRDQLRGSHISVLAPHRDIHDKMILEFREGRVKVMEIHPHPDEDSDPARVLKVTIVRVSSDASPGVPGALTPAPSPEEEFRLLMLEDVTEKVMLEEQLVQAEKLAGMGQLAAGIAHELGNPLNSMSSNLHHVRAGLAAQGHAELIEPLDVMLENLDQMHRLLRSLCGFTGQRRPHYHPARLNALIRRSLAFIRKEAERHGIELAASLEDSLPPCDLDVRTINQVLLNIFKNAIEAMPAGGRLTIRSRLGAPFGEGGEAAIIEIEDTGGGIEEGDLRKVFRPLYSTKPRGMGLGLSFCRQVVEEHGGTIRLHSLNKKGTTVSLILPVHQEATEETATRGTP